jgi:hypothetical protein
MEIGEATNLPRINADERGSRIALPNEIGSEYVLIYIG